MADVDPKENAGGPKHIGDLLDEMMSPEACAERMQARIAPYADFVTYDNKRRAFLLVQPPRVPYWIEEKDVSTPAGLVKWLAHLSSKRWVEPKHLAGLITLVDIHVGLYRMLEK